MTKNKGMVPSEVDLECKKITDSSGEKEDAGQWPRQRKDKCLDAAKVTEKRVRDARTRLKQQGKVRSARTRPNRTERRYEEPGRG